MKKPKILKLMLFFLTLNFYFIASANVEFCVVGDTGTAEKEQYQVAQAMLKSGCKKIIHTGDVIYERGVKSHNDAQWVTKFEDPYQNLILSGTEFYMSMGNHDHSAGKKEFIRDVHVSYANKNAFYKFPNLYYDFKLDNACFVAVDTERFDDEQESQVSTIFSGLKNCSWIFAFGHHPIVSSGKHGNAKPKSNVNKKLRPLLEQYADVYFAGHDHNLADEGFVGQNGFRQIVSGAGAKLRPVQSCTETNCLFAQSTLGFVKVYLSDKKLIMDFINKDLKTIYSAEMIK
jgi:tartrate-resistant acid phosphatase type 5